MARERGRVGSGGGLVRSGKKKTAVFTLMRRACHLFVLFPEFIVLLVAYRGCRQGGGLTGGVKTGWTSCCWSLHPSRVSVARLVFSLSSELIVRC